MAGVTTLSSTTISLASLPNSITANGNGVYNHDYGAVGYINITVGFVYSEAQMYSSLNPMPGLNGIDSGDVLNSTSNIYEIATPNVYPGGYSPYPYTATDVNVNYTLSITGILPNTTYFVRSYIRYHEPSGAGPYYKYGDQLSIQSSSGIAGGKGYYISSDTVGFYDPLQIRDANEGVDRVLTTDSSGLATWKPVKSLFTFGHYIGEKYGGGVVVAVWKEADDEKVLIVAPEDISTDELSIIGDGEGIRYKMGTGTYFDNPGSPSPGNTYISFHNDLGSGPYGGGNPQNIIAMCIHNFDITSVNRADYLKSWNGTGFSSSSLTEGGIGTGTYQYSKVIEKGLLRVKAGTTTNIFKVVGMGYHYPSYTTDSKYIAADYHIVYVGPGTVPGTTIGVFRIYVDYLGTETSAVTTGTGKNFPATGEVVTIAFDSTGTGNSYLPIAANVKWAAGAAATTAVGALGQSMYNGAQNTYAIVAQSNSLNTVYSAAKICADYRGSGYEDWYLPSYYELNQVFNQAAIVNKVLGSDSLGYLNVDYWSSTEAFSREAIAFNSSFDNGYFAKGKTSAARVRAVRKESVYTGDGLITNLDATNKKSFSDIEYLNIGTASKWRDLVNGGMTSSYWFTPMAYPVASSGGTTADVFPMLITIGIPTNIKNLSYRLVGDWWIDKVDGTSTPWLYNQTGPSSMTSVYFTVPTNNSFIKFDCFDVSSLIDPVKSTINVYVSVRDQGGYDGPYNLINTISDVTNTITNRTISLNYYAGRTISIRFTAPNAYYTSNSDKGGPAIDTIQVRGTSGGYQATGPVYSPYESGFISFNGTGSMTDTINFTNTFGSYFDITSPIGNSGTATVEIWMRLKDGYQQRMPFAWSRYSIYTGAGGGLGFNTGNSDLYGITPARVQSLGLPEKWAHYVFEMRSDVSYTNNKMYINGNEQVLSQVAGNEDAFYRNFNNGQARIGGWRSPDNNKLYLFRGDISVVRIYNRALTKDEIMKNYSTEKKRYEILPTILQNNIFASIDFDNNASYSGDGSVTGTVNDLSANARNADLTISGTTTKPSVVRTNSLYNGRELVFPGTIAANPYLSWADSVAFQALVNLSVSFWVKFSVHRTSEIIVRWNSAGSTIGPWEVFQSSSATSTVIMFRLKSSTTTFEISGTKTIPLNKWTHVCATYDNTTKKVRTYIDSVIDIDTATPTTFSIATGIAGQVCVGRYVTATSNYYPLQGSIASIQIYNKSLTAGEIKNNYDADKFRFDNFTDANKFYSHEINGNPTFSISQNLTLEIDQVSNEKVLKLGTNGISKWVDKSSLFSRPANYRYIGELYGGGIIVAMWNYPTSIFNYLIMSLEDVSASSQWSNVTNLASGATSDFKGESNQTSIIGQGSHTTSAAKLCDDYAGGGFTDWYLPSVFEMNQAFNAASIVDTALGSDQLRGNYWTSTEISATTAYYYSFGAESSIDYVPSIGYQKSGSKASTYRVRAFRLATNAVSTNVWDTTWTEDYTPWWGRTQWGDPTYWEMNFQPATYNPIDFDWYMLRPRGIRTSVKIGIPSISQRRYIAGSVNTSPNPDVIGVQGAISFTFSNTITTNETIIANGVCWSTTTTTPTISDSFTHSFSPSYDVSTPFIYGAPAGTTWDPYNISLKPTVYFRAFVQTPSGVYYSSNEGRNATIATYSTSPTAYSYWPSGCYTGTQITSVTTGLFTLFSTSGYRGNWTLTFKVTGSLVSSFDVAEFGVCWKGSEFLNGNPGGITPPTVNDNKVVGSGAYSSFNSTIVWAGVVDIAYNIMYGYNYQIDVCAYAITTSGQVFYGGRFYYPSGVSMA